MSSIFKNTGTTSAPRPASKGSRYRKTPRTKKSSQAQSQGKDDVSAQLSAIDSQLATIGESISAYSQGVDEFDKKVTKHEETVSDLGKQIAAAKPKKPEDIISEMLDELKSRSGQKYGLQYSNLANQIESIRDDYPEDTLMRAIKSGVDQISAMTLEDLKAIESMGSGQQ
tara:strand:- start:403 stop:912 length:510 start_codon:yes stop_codon:yes gene_type:complete